MVYAVSVMPVSQTIECKLCDGTGWRPVEKQDGGRTFRAVEPCSCQTPRRDVDWWLERARIPPRFRQCSFEGFVNPSQNASLQMALVKARGFAVEYPMVEKGLLLVGNPGVGKTHLAVAILRQLMTNKGTDCLFVSFPDLLEQLQESYDPVALRTKAEILQPVLDTEVVAIDDLGARRISDWVEDTVTYILNYRYNERKPTILTTNLVEEPSKESVEDLPAKSSRSFSARDLKPDTLQKRIGLRIYSRLFEMCEKIPIHAKDFRQEVKAHQGSPNGRFA
jgi:DNA replication protein DnaC